MIGRLKGTVVEKHAPDLLLDVHGVGYELQAPMSTFYRLPAPGETALLYTHMVVREDAQQLYGFIDAGERRLFRSLIRISGVGPKLALAILSGMDAQAFVLCVERKDTAALVRLPGVGKKTAERLLIEMRDRIREWHDGPVGPGTDAGAVSAGARGLVEEAETALVALGYKPQEASRAVAAVADDGVDSSEELIRRALKSMLPG